MVDNTQTGGNMRFNIHIKLLTYGAFAVICHLSGILCFYMINRADLLPLPLTRLCGEMLEHSLMSIAILAVGSLLLCYVSKEPQK